VVAPTKLWQKISSGGLSGIDQPSLLRRGSVLYVAWHRRDSGTSESVRSRLISAAGGLGAAQTAVSGWSGIVHDPVLVNTTSKALAVFGGIRTTTVGEDFSGQMAASDRTSTGWAFDGYSFGHSTSAYGSYGTAAVEWEGDQINAFALNDTITLHQGSDPFFPATSPDQTITEPSGTSTYYTAMAVDPATQKVWVAWYDLNSGTPNLNGIRYTTYLPTIATAATAPGSHLSNGDSLQPDQRVAMAGVASGPWVAYAVGYPTATSIRLFNLRTHVARTVPGSARADHIGLAAAPGGRLWVFWNEDGTNRVHTVRSNGSVTRFEPVSTITSWDVPTATAGDGTLGPLDLVVNSAVKLGSNDNELFYRRALARLSAVASVRKGKATILVTDAGAALKGARVTFGKVRVSTGTKGTAVLAVGTKKGKRTLTVAMGGYVTITLVVKV
jgi:hypothetical protein